MVARGFHRGQRRAWGRSAALLALIWCVLSFAVANTSGTWATLTDAQSVTHTLQLAEVPTEITVTLDANGGAFAADAGDAYGGHLQEEQTVFVYAGIASGSALSGIPTPVRDGYEFAGWYTQTLGGEYMAAVAPSQNVSYYAHWRHASRIFWALDSDGLMVVAPSAEEAGRGRPVIASDSFSRMARPNWDGQSESIVRVEVVGGVKPTSTEQWFSTERAGLAYYDFVGFPRLSSVDLSGLNGSELQSTRAMFAGCRALTSVTMGSLKTSEVKVMSWMFAYCPSLSSIDISSFDTRGVRRMRYLFEGCSALGSIVTGEFWHRVDWWGFPSARLPMDMYREDGALLEAGAKLDSDGAHVYTAATQESAWGQRARSSALELAARDGDVSPQQPAPTMPAKPIVYDSASEGFQTNTTSEKASAETGTQE